MDVEELRKSDRFVTVERIACSFGSMEASVINMSITGVQISHPQPIRIGTIGRLALQKGDAVVATQARVLWSHVAPVAGGKLMYKTGLRLENADAHYALALNTLLRAGLVQRDPQSLERKKKRDAEREEKKRKSGPRLIPMSEPPPS